MKTGGDEIDAYWRKNFSDKKIVAGSENLQVNIARTKGGERVSAENWNKTINYLIEVLNIDRHTEVLELCCGNGVVIGELSSVCSRALGVDYSDELLKQLKSHYISDNLSVVCEDILKYEIEADAFDTIIIYFSIQHFDERNVFLIIEKCLKALKVGGNLFVGDIPDSERKWDYINKAEYHLDYFKRLSDCTPKIGYWYQKEFFMAMKSCFPGAHFKILDQPGYQINSDHCFDLLIGKDEII